VCILKEEAGQLQITKDEAWGTPNHSFETDSDLGHSIVSNVGRQPVNNSTLSGGEQSELTK